MRHSNKKILLIRAQRKLQNLAVSFMSVKLLSHQFRPKQFN